MNFLRYAALFFLLGCSFASAQMPPVLRTKDVPPVTVSPGVILKELTGRTAPAGARSRKVSVAFFHLEPNRASAWSYNKVAEESFFILKGHGTVRTGTRSQAVGPGSYILVPPAVVRSVLASPREALEFYAVTSPAWSPDDDVQTKRPGR